MGAKRSLEELLSPRGKRALFQMEAAQEMARRLRKLAERHKPEHDPRYKADYCASCDTLWPCEDGEILGGR